MVRTLRRRGGSCDHEAVQLIGHAGLAASRPGGTHDRAGLDAALALDLARLEVDVARCADGALVLRHDLLLPSGRVLPAVDLDEARREAPGLLTLDEAVEHLAGRLPLLLDLKHDEAVDPLGAWAAGRADSDLLAVCTDGAAPLGRLRELAPRLARWRTLPVYAPHRDTTARRLAACALRDLLPRRLERLAAEVGAAAVTVDRWAVTRGLCATARGLGMPLTAWTVNHPRVAAVMERRGADFVTTDRPALLRAGSRAVRSLG
ncbi:MAG TPA: glycerophosphodiester phosphodiesterase [Candidatus Dormibacteraeota bacterium]|nr:glycerophosphodiester phosphodiesterase [Candidatus Dormibacteraeota bacterium]